MKKMNKVDSKDIIDTMPRRREQKIENGEIRLDRLHHREKY
jgi:hypothetical protein